MPLKDEGLRDVQKRIYSMFEDTIKTIDQIEKNADFLFGANAIQIKSAIKEYMDDFILYTAKSGETNPKTLIHKASKERYQNAGLYGAQLDVKERQVTEANNELRESLSHRARSFFRKPFKKWVDRVNNFLGSLTAATGVSEALKELKDCLRDELPEDDG